MQLSGPMLCVGRVVSMSQNNENRAGGSSTSQSLVKEPSANEQPASLLLARPAHVVNIGVPGFAEELVSQGVAVVQLDWRPPAGGDARLAKILSIVGT